MAAIKRFMHMGIVAGILSSLVLAGCGDDPVAPQAPAKEQPPPPPEIKTPTKLRVDWIYTDTWPKNKPDGAAWDTFGGNPDIYYQVGNHETDISSNHQWQVVVYAYFPTGQCRMNFNDTFTLNMWDADSPSADDKMASVTFSPKTFYENDNAEQLVRTVTGTRGTTFQLHGTWIYE